MSKYKVGDKVLLDGEVVKVNNDNEDYPYIIKTANVQLVFAEREIISKTYEDGLADAWELAKKLFADMSDSDLNEIFGKDWNYPKLMRLTPQQALAKIEAYEKSQQIQVGDVVRFKDSKTEVLITSAKDELNGIHIQTDEYGKFGDVHSCICRKDVEKTGKHLDIEHLLEQIRG